MHLNTELTLDLVEGRLNQKQQSTMEAFEWSPGQCAEVIAPE